MSRSPEPREEGLFASIKSVAATLLAMGQTRLELLGNEIETQKLLALRILMLAQALLFCAGVGVLLLVMFLVVLAWEQRAWVIGAFATLFVLVAVGLYRALMRAIDTPEPPFAATLAELQQDIRNLKAATGHANKVD
jgi:uncharacterized membrane protein YqjE